MFAQIQTLIMNQEREWELDLDLWTFHMYIDQINFIILSEYLNNIIVMFDNCFAVLMMPYPLVSQQWLLYLCFFLGDYTYSKKKKRYILFHSLNPNDRSLFVMT